MAENSATEINGNSGNLSVNIALSSPERSVDLYPNLKFEPGDHGDPQHVDSAMSKVRDGDLSPHIWNSEVGARVRQYQPQLLAIDGFKSGYDYKNSPG